MVVAKGWSVMTTGTTISADLGGVANTQVRNLRTEVEKGFI